MRSIEEEVPENEEHAFCLSSLFGFGYLPVVTDASDRAGK